MANWRHLLTTSGATTPRQRTSPPTSPSPPTRPSCPPPLSKEADRRLPVGRPRLDAHLRRPEASHLHRSLGPRLCLRLWAGRPLRRLLLRCAREDTVHYGDGGNQLELRSQTGGGGGVVNSGAMRRSQEMDKDGREGQVSQLTWPSHNPTTSKPHNR